MKIFNYARFSSIIFILMLGYCLVTVSCDDDDDDEVGTPTPTPVAGTEVGDYATDFTAPNKDDQNYTLSDYKGQVILLTFGATW
ncbi:peroxiredoxin family protein [candidate division CSSED10-310 bacterium]|uniref:Peroxiredoxin family protein n=1 Tax=candidate division CSSED10-310 bacterium TaxID=2855610 RepID=A0ABV6Z214_UNCC1